MGAIRRIIGLGLVLALAASPVLAGDHKLARNEKDDLFFDEAFYHAYQGQYFEAIQRLDTELGTVPPSGRTRTRYASLSHQ